ncbi:MAG: S8 family serine peptidase [Chitinophagales bacterium]
MYTYTFGGKKGKKRTLVESENRVVVRTKNARKLADAVFSEEGKNAIDNYNIEFELPEADVTILKSKEGTKNQLALRDTTRSVLKKEKELRFAGRVLMDEESKSPVVYTENLFIKFQDTLKTDACEKILEKYQLIIKQKLSYATNAYFVAAPENTGLGIFELSNNLLNLPETELCHPELIKKKSKKFIHTQQWHLKQATIGGVLVHAHVNAEKAHVLATGENIVIAIIDDGVDIDNPEFNIPGKVVHSRDVTLVSNNPKPKYADENHGTACAGVACASGIQASGVAPAAKLLPIRNASNLGSMQEANAFTWAADNGADVISCSWGPYDGEYWNPNDPQHFEYFDLPDSTRLAMDYAINTGRNGKGCVLVFAAGNGNEDVKYDGYASYEKVIAVAASNDTNKKSVYSDFGDAVWCCFPSSDWGEPQMNHPDAITPGIYTTDRLGAAGYNSNGSYCNDFGGTSSACPGVAGIAALILSANNELSWQQVKEIIKDSCEKIDTAGGNYNANGHSRYYGYGKPDAEKAVQLALSMKENKKKAVKIISALVNPAGNDYNNENITVINITNSIVNLDGWLVDVKNKTLPLTGNMLAGEAKTISLPSKSIRLSNTGATLLLKNPDGEVVQEAIYKKSDVRDGKVVMF